MRLGLRTETSPETLLEAAQSLHSAPEPTEELVTRAGALLHRLNTLAQEGTMPYQDLPMVCISHLGISYAMNDIMCVELLCLCTCSGGLWNLRDLISFQTAVQAFKAPKMALTVLLSCTQSCSSSVGAQS